MNHVMLDLETMGLRPTSAIVSIGACAFDPSTLVLGKRWYGVINLQSCLDAGLTIDGGTVMWWLQQPQAARDALSKEQVSLGKGLRAFAGWLAQFDSYVRVWGNGADFDNAMLAQAYRVCGMDVPWKFSHSRCYRTVKALAPQVEYKNADLHNALSDAVAQAEHLLQIVKTTGIKLT